jgi:hypothetical protein
VSTWLDSIVSDAFQGAQRLKPAVRIAHDAGNITLAGEQTIQSLAIQAGDRVALFGQTSAAENGIWVCAVGGWARAMDADAVGDLVAGTIVYVAEGDNAGGLLTLLTTGTIYPGVTAQSWQVYAPSVSFGGAGSISSIDAGDSASAGVAGTAARVDHQHAVNSASAATASTLVSRDGSGGAAFGWLSVGVSAAASGDVRVPTTFALRSGAGADLLISTGAGLVTFGSVARDTHIEALDLSLYSDSSGVTITSTAGGELDVQIPSGPLNIDAGGAVDIVGAAASQYGTTIGTMVLATSDDTSSATISAGTAGNAVSVACSSSGDSITCTINSVASLALSTTAATLGVSSLTWGATVSAPVIQQAARTSDNTPREITLASQAPYSSATGSNRNAPDVVLSVPSPAAGGTQGKVSIVIGGSQRACVEQYDICANQNNSGKPVRVGAYYPGGSPGTGYWAIYGGGNATSPNSGNYAFLGDDIDTYLNAAGSAGILYLLQNGAEVVRITKASGTAAITLNSSELSISSVSTAAALSAIASQSLAIAIAARTSDAAPQSITITTGAAWASATGANRKPGGLTIALGAPTNSGTDYSEMTVTRGSGLSEIHDYAQVTTTDTTTTTVWSYTMSDTTILHLEVFVEASRTDSGTNCAAYQLRGAFKRRGGGATAIGAATSEGYEDAAVSVTMDASSNDVRVRVGVARGSETWVWKCWVRVREVPTA